MASNITFSKGSFTVNFDTVEVSENYTNKLILSIPNIVSEKKQSGTLPDKKIIDLLWITHTYQIRGEIGATSSKTAKEVKDDLVWIFKGAQTDGGSVTMTYEGDTINGYIERLIILNKAKDYDPANDTDEKANYEGTAKYSVQITFVEGKSPSGG